MSKQNQLNWHKITTQVNFINKFVALAKTKGWRVVVSGGYGLDFALGRVSRNHGDIDLIIYGHDSRPAAKNILSRLVETLLPGANLILRQDEYYIDIKLNFPGLDGNLYYVQTQQDPFVDLCTVIKKTGEVVANSVQQFPLPKIGKIEDIAVEVQDQKAHLDDIIRKGGTKEAKYTQDIENIRQLLSQ